MRAASSKRDRVRAVFDGGVADRLPITFWQHVPGRDPRASTLAPAAAAFQQTFDLDIAKITPSASYPALDYGITIEPTGDAIGTTRVTSTPYTSLESLARFPDLDPGTGALAEQVHAVRLLREALGPSVPIWQTLFLPLTVVSRAVGGRIPPGWLQEGTETVRAALRSTARTASALAAAFRSAGADGVFVSSQFSNAAAWPAGAAAYLALAGEADREVLAAARSAGLDVVLHLHGPEPFLELAAYPIDGISWHDRETAPALAEGQARFGRCVMGGIHKDGAILGGTPADVRAEVHDAIASVGGRGAIIAPGCTVPLAATASTLHAARAAMEDA